MKEKKLNQKLIYQILSFVIPFVIYVLTLSPTVTFIDSGELATAASKLAIAHPTGYPLFTALGRLFTLLPIGDEVYRLNLMSAVISSIVLLIFFNLLVFIINDLNLYKDIKSRKKDVSNTIVYNISLASVLILSFSKTFWDTANSIEVYSLHSFFIVLNIYLFLKAIYFNGHLNEGEEYWVLFAFVLGLSFTNHLSTMFLSIGFLYLYFSVYGFNKNSFKRILILIIPFLLGLTLYIYLFVRAENDLISWGYPNTFEKLLKHITGRQFSMLMFASSENMSAQLSYFFNNFPLEFFYIPLLIAVSGLVELYKRSIQLFIFTFILFVSCILWASNYNIYDIDPYFLLAIIITSIWIVFGLLFILQKFKKNNKEISYAALLVCFIPLVQNFSINDKSKDYAVQDFTYNLFKSAPDNSMILTTQWNYFVAPSLYYQLVKNERPDLIIINKELLSESWYLRFLQMHYRELMDKSKYELEAYLAELKKFETNSSRYMNPTTNADNQEIIKFQNAFTNFVNSVLDKNYSDRNIFTTYEIEEDKTNKFGKDYSRIPYGLLVKYTKDINYIDDSNPEFIFTINDKTDYYNQYIKDYYYQSYLRRANYLMNNGKLDEAEKLVNKVMDINSNSTEAKQLLQKINQLKSKQN